MGGPNAHIASIEDQNEADLIWLIMLATTNMPGGVRNYWLGYVKNGAGMQ